VKPICHGAAFVLLASLAAACGDGEASEKSGAKPTPPAVASVREEPRLEPRVFAKDGPSLVVLGSGTPVPDPERSGPSAAVVVGRSAYLVDFGAGIVRRAAEAYRNGFEALDARRLTIAFATHLHSDHTAGYADLVLTPAVVGRHQPLRVFGPRGLRAMTDHLLAAYAADFEARRATGDDLRGYEVEVTEVSAPAKGMIEVYRDENAIVRAFAVSHGRTLTALGYRFDTGARSFVISGDTAPADAVVDACAGCDVLLHEVYCERGLLALSPSQQAYHRSHHTSAVELGALASRAKPKLLAATHVLDFGCSDAQILAEIAEKFAGLAVVARDLDSL
jgi:ribonuclease BN (tRNA processing enzyme)